MRTILLATNNAKKGKELAELCAERFTVQTLRDAGFVDDRAIDVVEDAPDFLGNALLKANAVVDAVVAGGLAFDVVVADDSGLCVDALDGRPGVRSARFAADAGYAPLSPSGERLSVDAANNRLLLTLLGHLPPTLRGAAFTATVVAIDVKTRRRVQAVGRVQGQIAFEERGVGGFGYDPLFIVDDDGADAAAARGKRMAELSAAEKHALSHRGRAMRELLAQL